MLSKFASLGIGSLLSGVGSLAKDIRAAITGKELIDPQKQAEINMMLLELEARAMEADTKLDSFRTDIIVAEANGEGYIQRNWRPITMLTFVGLVVAKWFGFAAPGVTEEIEMKLFDIIQLGLGGYVIGRSAEKVAKVWKETH
jgi:hypothetical protein